MKKLFVLLSFTILILSCTTYQPMGIGGGYSDTPLGGNKYQVFSRGNAFASAELVRNIALVRGAELTLRSGHKYFLVVDTFSEEKTTYYNDSQGNLQSHTKPQFSIVVMFTDNPEDLDAEMIIASYGNQVGY